MTTNFHPAHSLSIVDAHAMTDKGLVREANEDALLSDPDRGIFVLSDGMGGHPAGEVASSIAVAESHKALATFAGVGVDLERDRIRAAFKHADKMVKAYGEAHPEARDLGATLVTLSIDLKTDTAWIAHVADSRAYLFRRGNFRQLTTDHHGSFGMLSQAIGMLGERGADVSRLPLRSGDVLLLCSDGLTNVLRGSQIAAVLAANRSAKTTCQTLVDATLAGGAPDNVSVIVVKIG